MARVEVLGADRIPAEGPVVLAVNHRNYLDGPFPLGFLPRLANCLVKVEAQLFAAQGGG